MSAVILLSAQCGRLDMIEDLKNISTCQDEENDENFREKNNLDSSPSNFFGEENVSNKLFVNHVIFYDELKFQQELIKNIKNDKDWRNYLMKSIVKGS